MIPAYATRRLARAETLAVGRSHFLVTFRIPDGSTRKRRVYNVVRDEARRMVEDAYRGVEAITILRVRRCAS